MVDGKKLHQLAHTHLQLEFLADELCLFPGNAGDLRQTLGFPLHDEQRLFSKMSDDPLCHPGTDALDDPAGKIAQNFHTGLGHEPFQKFRLKLAAVASVIAPFARHHQPLAHSGQRNGSHNRHRLAAAHIQAQHGIAVVIILIYHGAHCALEDLHFLFRQDMFSPVPAGPPMRPDCIFQFRFRKIVLYLPPVLLPRSAAARSEAPAPAATGSGAEALPPASPGRRLLPPLHRAGATRSISTECSASRWLPGSPQ